MSVRVAVIGAGLMGADHARIVADDLPGATLQVVCDMDGARAKSVADACGALDVSSDAEGTIARDDVDAVIVASPDFTHTPLSLACIGAGKPVLCEKPLSQSSSECLSVIDAEMKAPDTPDHLFLSALQRIITVEPVAISFPAKKRVFGSDCQDIVLANQHVGQSIGWWALASIGHLY
jgi:hypothetical protein